MSLFSGTKLSLLLTKIIIDGNFDAVLIRYERDFIDFQTLVALNDNLRFHKSINWMIETLDYNKNETFRSGMRQDRMMELNFVSIDCFKRMSAIRALHEIAYVLRNPGNAANITEYGMRLLSKSTNLFVVFSVDGDSVQSYIFYEKRKWALLTNLIQENIYDIEFLAKYLDIFIMPILESKNNNKFVKLRNSLSKSFIYLSNFLTNHLKIKTLIQPSTFRKEISQIYKIQQHMIYDEIFNFRSVPVNLTDVAPLTPK